jgi:hypothetical protein
MLNLLWHRLQDPETLPARITPGGFPNASLAAKKERILSNPEYASKVLVGGVIDMDKLNELAADEDEDYKTTYDVTDPSTLIYYNQQNQIAGTLIGVFANQNSNHTFASMAKECMLSEPISFCGHSYKDLINAPKGTNPALTLAEFLASSVDAVKDPVLNYLNLNKITANAGALLGRLGYSAEEIGLLFNQPIIKELCEKISSDVYLSSNRDIDTAIKELIKNSRSEGFGEEVKRRILLGTYVLSSGYYDAYYKKAQQVRTLVMKKFSEAFVKYDVILTPTSPTTAFKIGEKSNNPLEMYLSDICTVSVNIAGLPGISIPCGLDSKGLPIGMQLIGNKYAEETIIKAAHAYERQTNFRENYKPTFKGGV